MYLNFANIVFFGDEVTWETGRSANGRMNRDRSPDALKQSIHERLVMTDQTDETVSADNEDRYTAMRRLTTSFSRDAGMDEYTEGSLSPCCHRRERLHVRLVDMLLIALGLDGDAPALIIDLAIDATVTGVSLIADDGDTDRLESVQEQFLEHEWIDLSEVGDDRTVLLEGLYLLGDTTSLLPSSRVTAWTKPAVYPGRYRDNSECRYEYTARERKRLKER